MSEDTYYFYVHLLIIFNTIDILGKAGICFFWTNIIRVRRVQIAFGGAGGALVMFAIFRLLASILPISYEVLLIIGTIYSLVNLSSTSAMAGMTWMAHKAIEKRAKTLAASATGEEIFDRIGDMFTEHGRAKGWL